MSENQIKPIDFNKVLPAATADQYKIKGLEKQQSTKIVFHKHGTVDFKTLSLERAAQLVKQGAPFIEKKAKNEGGDKSSK